MRQICKIQNICQCLHLTIKHTHTRAPELRTSIHKIEAITYRNMQITLVIQMLIRA
jgi:hypothetical protein